MNSELFVKWRNNSNFRIPKKLNILLFLLNLIINMFKCLNKTLRFIDLNGININFTLKGSNRVKTTFGGVLTIIQVILLLCGLWVIGNDLIYKQIPTISFEKLSYDSRPAYNLNSTSFPISFQINNYNGTQIPNISNYFHIEVGYFKLITPFTIFDNSSSIQNYTKCRPDHFPLISLEKFNKQNLGINNCLDNQSFTISGNFDEDQISQLYFALQVCDNKTNNNSCYSQEIIDSYIENQGVNFYIFFQETFVKSYNFSYPIDVTLTTLFRYIKPNLSYQANIFIKKQTIKTDQGFFIPYDEEDSGLFVDSVAYNDQDLNKGKGIYSIYTFSSSKTTDTYHRSYIKITNVLAQLGGIKEFFFTLSYFISYYFSITRLKVNLLNCIYKFDFMDEKDEINLNNNNKFESFEKNEIIKIYLEKKKENKDKISENKKLKNGSKKSIQIISKEISCTSDVNEKINKFTENYLESENICKMKLDFNEVIKMILGVTCCMNDSLKMKSILYWLSKDTTNDLLDIITLLKRLEDFDNFKSLLLDKEEIEILKFVSKQKLTFQDENLVEKLGVKNEFNDLKKSIINFCNKIQRKSFKNEIDKKIIEKFGNDLKTIVEN